MSSPSSPPKLLLGKGRLTAQSVSHTIGRNFLVQISLCRHFMGIVIGFSGSEAGNIWSGTFTCSQISSGSFVAIGQSLNNSLSPKWAHFTAKTVNWPKTIFS